MEDRMTISFVYIALISACFSVAVTAFAFFASYTSLVAQELSEHAVSLCAVYEQLEDDTQLALFCDETISVQLFDVDGDRIYPTQSVSDGVSYDAIDFGAETSVAGQYTAEDGTKMIYSAVALQDGTVLCVSEPKPDMLQVYSGSFGYILLIFLILIPLSVLFSLVITRRLLRPIRQLHQQLLSPSFSPQKLNVYPELLPLLQEISDRRDEREAMRQEFTANVSHELKTPLTTISGYSEMIASGLAKQQDVARFAEQIHAESERMQRLVGDIIELNALDSETAHPHEEQVNVLALVQDCIEQLSPQFAAMHLSVSVTGEVISVFGHQRQLWELVYNLLDNARRYNVDGGMIRVSAQDNVLTVKDTGIGIAKQHQSRVFERFYRVDKSHSRATGGTGLGLSIVKHVAELHGAMLELESTEHIGTEIRVRFPR